MTAVLLACVIVLAAAGTLFWRAHTTLRKAEFAYADARGLNEVAGQQIADAKRIRQDARNILARAQELDPEAAK